MTKLYGKLEFFPVNGSQVQVKKTLGPTDRASGQSSTDKKGSYD